MKNRITSKQIPEERRRRLELQGHCCKLCGAPITDTDIVHLDHSHDTGALRGSLHGTCNMLLGKIERGLKRGIRNPEGFLKGLLGYVNQPQDELLHPTWLSPDEKRAKAKAKAKRKRVTKVTAEPQNPRKK